MTERGVPERVGVVEAGDDVFIALLPDGPILRLTDTAAIIWTEALRDAEAPVAERVAAVVGLPTGQIQDDVNAFIDTLIERGLLERRADRGY